MITTMRGDKQVEAMQYILSMVSLNATEPNATKASHYSVRPDVGTAFKRAANSEITYISTAVQFPNENL